LLARRTRHGGQAGAYLAIAAIFAADYAILRAFLRFDFLVSHERTFYADRMLDLFLISLAPAVCFAVGSLTERLARRPAVLRLGLVALLACVITASTYLAYPRRDKYESSRGWSVSGPDVETVRLIDKDAGNLPYVVLADQSVSAAAIREVGFKKYFDSTDPAVPGPIFFYPIPTGGPLYARFEAMNESAGARAEAEKAMALTGTQVAYFVVNHYWNQAQKIIIGASAAADAKWVVGDNKDFVFKYLKR
jgi:hypothetical protein